MAETVAEFARLVAMRDDVYGGSWEKMRDELEAKIDARWCPARIAKNIKRDLERVKEIMGEG